MEPPPAPRGAPLTTADIQVLAAAFDDQVFEGGQVAPRLSRWVNEDTFIFLQFDKSNPAEATALRYIGIGVKGVYCAEARPDAPAGSFTHFHRYNAPRYADGHGGQAGEQGYWLTWVAVDSFEVQGRKVSPGVDYGFSPTPPAPSCGPNVPAPGFTPPDAQKLAKEEIQQLAPIFKDQVLTGGQVAPRLSRWVNENAFVFIQLDKSDPKEATALRYFGIGVRGEFCKERQPSADFTHYHRINAARYAEGHAGQPGEKAGYWLLWLASDSFQSGERQVAQGVDRAFSPTPPPDCSLAGTPTPAPTTPAIGTPAPAGREVMVKADEFRFDPVEVRVRAGETVSFKLQNTGKVPHTFTIPDLSVDTGTVEAGRTRMLTFTAPAAPGTYRVICTQPGHEQEGMVGRLIVE